VQIAVCEMFEKQKLPRKIINFNNNPKTTEPFAFMYLLPSNLENLSFSKTIRCSSVYADHSLGHLIPI
jgi:hypothetical protein